MSTFRRLTVAIAGAIALLALGLASSASAGTGNWTVSYGWGGEYRMSAKFDAAGSEYVYAMDTNSDGYGAYVTWWSNGRSGNCNDTNGGTTLAWVPCGPLNLPEGLAFDIRMCSRDYSGSTLVDSHCDSRFRIGTT